MTNFTWMAVFVAAQLLLMLVLGGIFLRQYRRVRPGQALVIYGGRRGMRVVLERGALVFPVVEASSVLDLTERSLRLQVEGVNLAASDETRKFVRLDVRVLLGIEPSEAAVRRAAERFLDRSVAEIDQVARAVLEGHLHTALIDQTVQDLKLDPERAAEKILAAATPDLVQMGLRLRSVVLQGVDEGRG